MIDSSVSPGSTVWVLDNVGYYPATLISVLGAYALTTYAYDGEAFVTGEQLLAQMYHSEQCEECVVHLVSDCFTSKCEGENHIIENLCKFVKPEQADMIIETGNPKGKFITQIEGGIYVGISTEGYERGIYAQPNEDQIFVGYSCSLVNVINFLLNDVSWEDVSWCRVIPDADVQGIVSHPLCTEYLTRSKSGKYVYTGNISGHACTKEFPTLSDCIRWLSQSKKEG